MKITIVGGGTAGWMSAAYLSKRHPTYTITVIDKEVGTPIGVGEATVLDFGGFMKDCGFHISSWLPAVDGSFKSGILFPNWKHKGNTVWHPFFTHCTYDEYGQWDIWAQDQSQPFETHGLPLYSTSIANKVDHLQPDNYAYHIDCSKLVLYIQQQIQNFVTTIRSTVVEVVKDGNNIKELVLANGNKHTADLFIDCTGFASLLKPQDKINLEDRLFCNTAIAGHIPYIDKEKELRPYVISEAVDCGWIWKIPVESRIGSGLVFNRNITSVEEAKDYYLAHWDNRTSRDKLKVIDWTPYYVKNQWEGNVVSVGLSGGFIEPLESTGLSLMRTGIYRISEKIQTGKYNNFDADLFNSQMIRTYEDTVDFINMHYADTERDEPFWQYVKSKHVKSDTQQYYEMLMADSSVSFVADKQCRQDHKMFHVSNWMLWLIQLRYPVNKNVHYPPHVIKSIMDQFLINERARELRSIPHLDVKELVNIGGTIL